MRRHIFEEQREHMVAIQLRARGITDEAVLSAMASVPREVFVPPEQCESSYEDRALSVGLGQTISQPWIVAYMTQALALEPHDRVLEVGTGSGYQGAVLSRIVKEVYSIERLPELSAGAGKIYGALGYGNIYLTVGDGTEGWPDHAPYDAIMVTAASPVIPEPLKEQMAQGGRLILPLESDFCEVLMLVTRKADQYDVVRLCECRFVPLIGRFGYHGDR
ncbi:MAG: protein-L-isoaspartate(D-aspartate) O-methyltransferase [Candidatus Eremiobacteraeota bacterium]|nr:protein-L-isoaspartate(D-aspartate) O-methyltransferase [Candidatus Eremiobacteraeota bacterium]